MRCRYGCKAAAEAWSPWPCVLWQALDAQWRPDLLGGVMAIRGRWAGGGDLTALPNYARNNRGGRSIVWIREK